MVSSSKACRKGKGKKGAQGKEKKERVGRDPAAKMSQRGDLGERKEGKSNIWGVVEVNRIIDSTQKEITQFDFELGVQEKIMGSIQVIW